MMTSSSALAAIAALSAAQLSPNAPIAADRIIYLTSNHGVVWKVEQEGGEPAHCHFDADTDYRTPSSIVTLPGVPSAADCCEHCWSEALCAASVYDSAKQTCELKRASEISNGTIGHEGRTSCAKRRLAAPATPRLSIPATVPGDLLTDLERAGQIGDPLYEKAFLNSSVWSLFNWTYRASVVLDEVLRGAERLQLVFDGVKMGAQVSINGQPLGLVTDQFLRYTFGLHTASHQLRFGSNDPNTLEIKFDPAIDVHGRYMACTGGWDWAPYSHSFSGGAGNGRARVFSKGIWRDVYLAATLPAGAAIVHVVPQVSRPPRVPRAHARARTRTHP